MPAAASLSLPSPFQLIGVILVSVVSGAMNSVAGGGTLLTFPALVGLGIPPIVANATSTVALWPASLTSMLGYRRELSGSLKWAIGFALPSLLGGGIGAWLLLRTPPARFNAIVPWLVLGATGLFMLQPVVMRRLQAQRERAAGAIDARAGTGAGAGVGVADASVITDESITAALPSIGFLVWQLAISIYGGYFGAGAGILMLAVLGFIGLTNIHRMNGLKNWGGMCMNAVAAITFAVSGLVSWPIALAMAAGSMSGGYLGSQGAQRIPRHYVRYLVVLIGLTGGIWLLVHGRHS